MLVIAAVVLIGHTQPIPERVAMLHLDMCLHPCWIGITPGVTTLDEAYQRIKQVFPESHYKVVGPPACCIIQDLADSQLEFTVQFETTNEYVVDDIALSLNEIYTDDQWMPVDKTIATFGDLNILWGNPHYITVWPCYGNWLPQYDSVLDDAHIVVSPSNGFPDASARSSWNDRVELIQMYVGKSKTPTEEGRQ